MVNKTISIPYDIDKLLKEEENASALITKLLEEHYKFNVGSKDEVSARLLLLEDKQNKQIEVYEKEIQKLEEVKENIHNKEQDLLIQEELQKEKDKGIRKSRNKYFKDITHRDMTDQEHEEFNQLFEEEGTSIIKYADEKKDNTK